MTSPSRAERDLRRGLSPQVGEPTGSHVPTEPCASAVHPVTTPAHRPTGVLAALDRYQQRHRMLGFPLGVIYKFADDQGALQAALITYYGFVSLFPLLLLLISLSGFVLHADPALQDRLLNSAARNVPVIGTDISKNLHNIQGSGLGLLVGLLGTLYGALGLAQASQTVFNRIYAVPRWQRPNPFRSRLRSLLLLLLLGSGVLITSSLSALPTHGSVDGVSVGPGLQLGALLLSTVANIGLFLAAFRLLPAHRQPIRQVLVGGTVAGVAWQALQSLGALYVTRKLAHTGDVYGVFGLVLGSIAWIYVEALVVVFCAEINVVLHHRLWPRALLTPFTDNVTLTESDRRTYTAHAQAEQFKGFQRVDVTFDEGAARPSKPDRRTER